MVTPIRVSLEEIHPEWKLRIKEILREFDRVHFHLYGRSLMEADLLEDETWKRLTEKEWFLNLLEHLRSLEKALLKEEEERVWRVLELTRALIREIKGEQE
jgi:hypothetical protein